MRFLTFLILCNIILVRGMKENEPCTGKINEREYRGQYRIDRYTFHRLIPKVTTQRDPSHIDEAPSHPDDRMERVQFGCPSDVDVSMYGTSTEPVDMVYDQKGNLVEYTMESYVCCARIPCSGRYSQSYCRDSFKRESNDPGMDVEDGCPGYGYSCWIKPGQPSPKDHADNGDANSEELNADAGISSSQADSTNAPGDGTPPAAVQNIAAIDPGLSPDEGEAIGDEGLASKDLNPSTDLDAFNIDDTV